MTPFIIICPNCQDYVIIQELNCCIFRHGIFKNNGNQIDPHTPKALCDQYIETNAIYGCGKPFKILISDLSDKYNAVVCDYI